MRPVSLVVAVAAALGSAPALAAPPTTPSDLRVDVYSGTAAELFWGRSSDPDGAVSRYEIRRDGQLVDTRDGLSYFTDDLTDGRAFAFTVTAVDFDGMRSAPAAVSVVGGDRGGATGAGGGRPPPPANLTSSVYSSSAAEVFWDRSDQRGLSYEVSVDGGPVTTTTGTSAFLSGLDGTRGRGVDVVAIDANGQRSGAANVTLGGGSGNANPMEPVTPPPGGEAPAAPSSLRGERYSSNAGEVFWDRVSGTNLSYEVSLDGEVVSTTTGTSYFAGNVPGIDGTRVEVVAIGPGGARSSTASVTIGNGGTSSADPDPEPNPGTDGPPAPANARIEVYSGTAAELFFDRAPASANVARIEVSRDGTVIGETNGTSFFDPNRVPGRDYVYELVAVNASGTRSNAATVEEAPPSQNDDLPADAAARLDTVFAITNGDAFGPLVAFLDRLRPFDTDDRTPVSSAPDPVFLPNAGSRRVFACPDGGAFAVTVGTEGSSNIFRTTAEGCTIGSATVDGTFVQQSFQNGVLNPLSSNTDIEDYRLVDARTGTVTAIDEGQVIETESRTGPGAGRGPFVPTSWEASGLSVTGSDADYAASSVDVFNPEVGSLTPGGSGGLTVRAAGLSSALYDDAALETGPALRRDGAEGRYMRGSLIVVDGERRERLDADGGDPAAFTFTVEEGGATTSYTVPWSDRFDFERFDTGADASDF